MARLLRRVGSAGSLGPDDVRPLERRRMPLTDPALRDLAELYQISTEFWDWKGHHSEVDDASVIAVLSAFDVDASTPEKARAAVDTYHARLWQRALPPCVVVEQGAAKTFPVHVRQGAAAHVFIKLEDGGSVDARQHPHGHGRGTSWRRPARPPHMAAGRVARAARGTYRRPRGPSQASRRRRRRRTERRSRTRRRPRCDGLSSPRTPC